MRVICFRGDRRELLGLHPGSTEVQSSYDLRQNLPLNLESSVGLFICCGQDPATCCYGEQLTHHSLFPCSLSTVPSSLLDNLGSCEVRALCPIPACYQRQCCTYTQSLQSGRTSDCEPDQVGAMPHAPASLLGNSLLTSALQHVLRAFHRKSFIHSFICSQQGPS